MLMCSLCQRTLAQQQYSASPTQNPLRIGSAGYLSENQQFNISELAIEKEDFT